MKKRCSWVNLEKPVYVEYHDKEWGVPVREDRKLFEMLILEGAQAGLSWETILNKRENYRRVFKRFDAKKVARLSEREIAKALLDPGIVRNRLKVRATVLNAKAYLKVQKEFGSFERYLWQFVGGKPVLNSKPRVKSSESDAMSKDLKKRGFKFVGSTICYAFMQAVGMINDHQKGCYRYRKR